MNVHLIDYTGAGAIDPARHAANVLVFTKGTRLQMRPGLFEAIATRPWDAILAELRYMANTIPSSWEFVTYTFLLTDVTRAFTHQLVRTRSGSYAQQTMRVLDMGTWTYGTGPGIAEDQERRAIYDGCMRYAADAYRDLIESGAPIEDARGVLPTNIHTNIVAKFDLRSLCDTFRKRASQRTQGEYRSVIEIMKAEVMQVHPWTKLFIERTFDKAAAELETGIRAAGLPEQESVRLTKLIDQLRATA